MGQAKKLIPIGRSSPPMLLLAKDSLPEFRDGTRTAWFPKDFFAALPESRGAMQLIVGLDAEGDGLR